MTDQIIMVSGNTDGKSINPGKLLEENRLPFHDRNRRSRTDIAESQDGSPIGDDGDGIAF